MKRTLRRSDVEVVADLLEDPQHVVVEAPAHAADDVVVADPLGDRGQDDEFLVEVARLDQDQQPLVVVPDLEETVSADFIPSVSRSSLDLRARSWLRRLGGRNGRQRRMLGDVRFERAEAEGQNQRREKKSGTRLHKPTPN